MYSSIKHEQLPKVIENCYWPLLELVENKGVPIGIELSGYTLEQINLIDNSWIRKLQLMLGRDKLEVIGSGYAQIAGPLVPAEVNRYNQEYGLQVYINILGYKPKVALINEQAYSSGLIGHYKDAGYKAIIMEWDNSYRFHQEWNKQWRFYPQIACDNKGNDIPVIWNNAIAFQKFQRYAHGENEIKEYLEYIEACIGKRGSFFSLYGNDAEIFDFRPGRYETEAKLHRDGEWKRIERLFQKIKNSKNLKLILPSEVLAYSGSSNSANKIHIESPEQPIPVKKQEKYNITRWALTGRNSTKINTKCYQFYNYLKKLDGLVYDNYWRDLCYFFSSDFRTHIEKKRWISFNKKLDNKLCKIKLICENKIPQLNIIRPALKYSNKDFKIKRVNSKIFIETKVNQLILDCNKGLTIESVIFKNIFKKPLFGTIPHGFYDNIGFGADFYSGHTIIEEAGKKKITDLCPVIPCIQKNFKKGYILIAADINTKIGKIKKQIYFYILEPKIGIYCDFDIHLKNFASVKSGIITLFPHSFNQSSLYYKTVNGGYSPETFRIKDNPIGHSDPVDSLVSASHCLGATEGWIEIGDKEKCIRIISDKPLLYTCPMIKYQPLLNTFFLRCYNSIKEIDDTSKGSQRIKGRFELNVTAKNNK